MRKPFMLISVLPITVHISHDTDTGSNRIGGIPEKYAFKNKVLRSICFVLFLLSIGLNSAFAQVRNAAGLVVDENGQPLIGVQIKLEGTTTGVITDVDGNFSINAKKGDILLFSYVGYEPQRITYKGEKILAIKMLPNTELLDEVVVNPHLWRAKTGAVMQDGFIFSETIAQNIVVGEEQVDVERLRHAVTVANIRDFIDSLPLGYNTKIGMEGNGISQGQKQRLLIARAVYKNPEFLFFDEATNALDANNEKEIMEHLHEFYKGKTVVVVAHRLSTVKDADKIVVLDKGCIVEEGTHRELTERKGLYYRLVKNQLELGS